MNENEPPHSPEEIEEICRRLDALKESVPEPEPKPTFREIIVGMVCGLASFAWLIICVSIFFIILGIMLHRIFGDIPTDNPYNQ